MFDKRKQANAIAEMMDVLEKHFTPFESIAALEMMKASIAEDLLDHGREVSGEKRKKKKPEKSLNKKLFDDVFRDAFKEGFDHD